MASGSFAVASSNNRISAILKWSSTTNVAGNYSTVYCELRASRTNSGYTTYGTGSGTITINGTPVNFSISSSQKITQNSNTLLGSASVTVYHDDNGSKKINISVSASIPGASLTLGTTTGSATLDTIPRKSTMSVGNGTLGTAQTLTVTRQSSSFTHTITYECGTYTGTICDKSTSTSISFTPLLDFANGAPYGTSVYVSFTITTYNGNTSIGSNSYAIWCNIPDSVKPSATFTITDPSGLLDRFGAYVQSKSCFVISVTANGIYGSTISTYKIEANGKTYNTSKATTDIITSSGDMVVKVTVTDSRGRSVTVTKNVNVLPYNKPKISNLKIKRSDSNGNSDSSGGYLTVNFDSKISSLNGLNGCNYSIEYKKTKDSDSSYTYVSLHNYANKLDVTNGTYTFQADTSSSYDVRLIAADNIEQIVIFGTGTATSKLFSFLNKGLGFAFGKVAELEDTLEVAFNAVFYKPVNIKSDLTVDGNIKMNGNNVQKAISFKRLEITVSLESNQYVKPFSYFKTIDLSDYSSNGYLINASAVDTSGAPVPVSLDTDGVCVRVVSTTQNVVLKLIYVNY